MGLKAYINITSAGDAIVIPGEPGLKIDAVGYNLSGNGLDQILTIKSGGAGGGQSNASLVPFTVGPNSGIPGVTGQYNPEGWFDTIGKPPGTTPDDLVINVVGTNGNSTILLTGHITYKLISS